MRGKKNSLRAPRDRGARAPRSWVVVCAAALTLLAVGLELAYDAAFGDVVLYLGYVLAFVVVPGCLVVAALRPELRGTLTGLGLGWAAGYVLEILAFDLTAALSIRWAFYAYPLMVALVSLPVMIRRRGETGRTIALPPVTRGDLMLVTGLCSVALVYVGVSLFGTTLLPGNGSVNFNQDASWSISLAADLLHHFPLGDPNISGEPLVYHYFASAHMAAAGQVTDIALPPIFLRLYALPMIACAVVGFAAAGQRLFGSAGTGVLGGGLCLLVGEIQLDPRLLALGQVVFVGVGFTLILASPSFLFGLVILIPLVLVLAERLAAERGTPGEWALVALLVVGASGAKVTILPLLGVALGLYAGWLLLRRRHIPRQVFAAGAIVFGVELAVYLSQYLGHSSGVRFDLAAGYDFIQNMPGVRTLKEGAEDLLPSFTGRGVLLGVAAVPVGLVGLFGAQLAGIWLYVRRRERPLPTVGVWLICILAAGALGMAFLIDPDVNSQLYYVFYATFAAGLLSAAGLVDSWSGAGRPARRTMLILTACFALAAAVLVAAVTAGSDPGDGFGTPAMLWALYGGVVVLLVLIWLVGRAKLPSLPAAAIVVCSCIVLTGLIDIPVDRVIPALKDPASRSDARAGLTPGLNDALVWTRDNTDTDSIVATSNPGPLSFDYAAFGERRIFLGGWAYSIDAREAGYTAVASGATNPYVERLGVNAAAFAGDPEALATLRAGGVDYLLLDKVNGPQVDAAGLEDVGQVVFENSDATVIEL